MERTGQNSIDGVCSSYDGVVWIKDRQFRRPNNSRKE